MAKKPKAKTKKKPAAQERKQTSATSKKRSARKKAQKRSATRRLPRQPPMAGRAGDATAAEGLDLISAGEIVQAAVPNGPHDIDLTLEDAGLISSALRGVFRQQVVDGVVSRGWSR
jgi:hypothetical protein